VAGRRSISCPRCSGSMEPGFIVDEGYGTRTASRWFRGEAQYGFFGSLKVRRKEGVDVDTYRCTRCGYLESYA